MTDRRPDLPRSTYFDSHVPGEYDVIVWSQSVGWVRKNRYPRGWYHNYSDRLFESRKAAALDLIARRAANDEFLGRQWAKAKETS